jgi:GNAT superfamily N-acetyltransferase
MRASAREIPAGISFRPGVRADLALLLELDLDASIAFERVGLFLDLPETHAFPVSERERLRQSLESGTTLVALDDYGQAVGFVALGRIDALAYVEQISVRVRHARRGIGTALLRLAWDMLIWRGETELWLTTYAHLSWNRPFYERNGFAPVPESECGPGILRELAFQRRWLPMPSQRLAMRRVRS